MFSRRLIHWLVKRDWRPLLLVIVLGVALSPFVRSHSNHRLYRETWDHLGVTAMLPAFADLRGVLSAVECFDSLGVSLYKSNPCDPWGRPFNYPRIWLYLHYFGLNQDHASFLGVVLAGVFYVAVFTLMGRINPFKFLVYGLVLCSPPMLLAIEI